VMLNSGKLAEMARNSSTATLSVVDEVLVLQASDSGLL